MLTKEEQIKLAAKLFGCSIEKINSNCGVIEKLNALYYSEPVRGGGSLIVGQDGSVLFANSSVKFSTHLKEFKKGRRTPIEMFNQNVE